MNITSLEVDGYGVWSGLRLDDVSEGLNVFFGANEAGKTTLLEFIRTVLYGLAPTRRQYLPPVHGGQPGGSVSVAGPNGRFQVSRYQNGDDPQALGKVVLSAPDGTQQGEHFLKVLLSNVDEPIFNNVFAVGLEELQELGTLDDTEAALLLYRFSAGLDRVSLVDVTRELEGLRERLLSSKGEPSQLGRLVAERDELRQQIEELDDLTHRYGRTAAQRDQLQHESLTAQIRHHARVLEIAAAVSDRWQRRAELDEQLRGLGPEKALPEGIGDRLSAVNEGLAKRRQRVDELRRQWETLRDEASGLKANEALWRMGPRIEALKEQESWIGSLRSRTSQLALEIDGLENDLSAEQSSLGLGDTQAAVCVSSGSLSGLRQPARSLRHGRQQLEEARQAAEAAGATARSLAQEIDVALSEKGESTLSDAMDRVGSRVQTLRRRVQIDERLDQMSRYQDELEAQSRQLLERQVLPIGVLLGVGGVFVVSVVLMLAG
ncbi:MAG: ATP-binding protein, partial [Planctomycetota bacterium]